MTECVQNVKIKMTFVFLSSSARDFFPLPPCLFIFMEFIIYYCILLNLNLYSMLKKGYVAQYFIYFFFLLNFVLFRFHFLKNVEALQKTSSYQEK